MYSLKNSFKCKKLVTKDFSNSSAANAFEKVHLVNYFLYLCFQPWRSNRDIYDICCGKTVPNAFPKRQILDSAKLKESADDNFNLNENGRVLLTCRKHYLKWRNCSL